MPKKISRAGPIQPALEFTPSPTCIIEIPRAATATPWLGGSVFFTP